MSLVKKPRMTEKRLAALQRNREHAHGPATRAGRERIRATHLRHGLYSQSDEAALRALGEDPADFQELLAGLRDQGIAGSILYDRLAKRLARALLRAERADHMADGYALRQAKAEEGTRQGRMHMQMMRLKMVARITGLLLRLSRHERHLERSQDPIFSIDGEENENRQGKAPVSARKSTR